LFFIFVLTLVTGMLSAQLSKQNEKTVDHYLIIKPNLGEENPILFFPETIVVNQGDKVNLTVRNLAISDFNFTIENLTSSTIKPAIKQNNGTVNPIDTSIPIFNASTAGIFKYNAQGAQDLIGQLVVTPSNWERYDPQSEHRKFDILIVPDFAGDGYDKFFPSTIVVNQGDDVSIKIHNSDEHPHGIAIAYYKINSVINPGHKVDSNSSKIQSTLTDIPTFNASLAGIFQFECTVYCGPGHYEMVGELVVLPTANIPYTFAPHISHHYLTVKPDLAGTGYDKFVPYTFFVNEGDFVYVKIRNTDNMTHGFAIPEFNLNNETVTAAKDGVPIDTYIPAFFASDSGTFEFFCTHYCGPGHYEMIGYITVLPQLSEQTSTSAHVLNQQQTAHPKMIFLETAAIVSLGMSITGFIIGLLLVSRFASPEKLEDKA
jgi:heme/copper-type cytochrome/quinol oxidase subunit 2